MSNYEEPFRHNAATSDYELHDSEIQVFCTRDDVKRQGAAQLAYGTSGARTVPSGP